MQNLNAKSEQGANIRRQTRVQVVESETCTILRELDATDLDVEKVAEEAMRNLNPYRYFTRVVGPTAPALEAA